MRLKFGDLTSIGYVKRQERLDKQGQIDVWVIKFLREGGKIKDLENGIEVYGVDFIAIRKFDGNIIEGDGEDELHEYTINDFDVVCDKFRYIKEKGCYLVEKELIIKK